MENGPENPSREDYALTYFQALQHEFPPRNFIKDASPEPFANIGDLFYETSIVNMDIILAHSKICQMWALFRFRRFHH